MPEKKYVDAPKILASWAKDQKLLFEHAEEQLESYLKAATALAEAFSPKARPLIPLLKLSMRLFKISRTRLFELMERVSSLLQADLDPESPDPLKDEHSKPSN